MYTININRNVRTCLLGAASLLLTGGLGCNTDGLTAAVPDAEASQALRTGNLQGHFEAGESLETSCGTVAGIAMTVDGPGESSVWCETDFESFDTDDTEYDNVADCFFVVKPGLWSVATLDALDGAGNTMDCCTSVLPDPVWVGAYETSEVQGAITCDVDQNGALDVIVTINVPPIIVDLDYTPSKFGSTCEAILLHVEAQDADGGDITYTWEVTDAPFGAEYELQSEGADASFAAKTLGDYELRVTAYDDQGASTYLDFPIHIVEATDLTCELAVICADELP